MTEKSLSNLNKINLNKPLLDFDDKQVSDAMLSKELSLAISNSQAADSKSVKYYGWAKSLWQTGKVELDLTDFNDFKEFVSKLKNLSVLAHGQIMAEILKIQPN